MLIESLMKTHVGYNIIDNLQTLWDMPNIGDHTNYHGICQIEAKRYNCPWKIILVSNVSLNKKRGTRVNLLKSIQIIAHES